MNTLESQSTESPRLQMLSPQRLIERINKRIIGSDEGGLSLTDFEYKIPTKPLIPHIFDKSQADHRGKYGIQREVQGRGLFGLYALSSDVRIGYIFIEAGTRDPDNENSADYEILKLKLKHPTELRGGVLIPECTIKILAQAEDCCPLEVERTDHIKRARSIQTKTNLANVLPTEWFFREGVYQPKEKKEKK